MAEPKTSGSKIKIELRCWYRPFLPNKHGLQGLVSRRWVSQERKPSHMSKAGMFLDKECTRAAGGSGWSLTSVQSRLPADPADCEAWTNIVTIATSSAGRPNHGWVSSYGSRSFNCQWLATWSRAHHAQRMMLSCKLLQNNFNKMHPCILMSVTVNLLLRNNVSACLKHNAKIMQIC
jgi:hypothetical protein